MGFFGHRLLCVCCVFVIEEGGGGGWKFPPKFRVGDERHCFRLFDLAQEPVRLCRKADARGS